MSSNSQALLTPATMASKCTCDVRTIESATAAELYLTVVPTGGTAHDLYAAIADILRDQRAIIVEERLFASANAVATALAARADAYADLDDGVLPSLLNPRTSNGNIVGVQVHAIRGIDQPAMVHLDGNPVGRTFQCQGQTYLTASGLCAPQLPDAPAQARYIFQTFGSLLSQSGGTLFDIARTWIWMEDILGWYPQLNQERNAFFNQHRLMQPPNHMPASTGIGVAPAAGRVAIDLFAAWGQRDTITRFHAAGNQRSACEYGSAFARASRAITPAGQTIFCSGTAAIDASGKTLFLNDIANQVRMTVDNVHAVLRDMHCGSADVVQAMAYCATPEVQQHFLALYADKLPWPCLTMLGDVCRDDLLFEIEVTATAATTLA